MVSVANASTAYQEAIRLATGRGPAGLIRVLNPDEVLANVKSANGEFLSSVGQTSKSYAEFTLAANAEVRNKQTAATIGFVADAMLVAKYYGIQGDEAVKMATRMGTMGRGPLKEVNNSFTFMAEQSKRLGTPMDMLMGTMEALAQATDGANLSTAQLTVMTTGYYDAIQKGQDSMVGFKDMRAGDVAKHVSNLMKSINSIDPKRVMALNQTPGGTFRTALENMYNDKLGGIDRAVENAARKMKLGQNFFNTEKGSVFGDYKLAMAMGLQGNERELIAAGEELRLAKKENRLSPEAVKNAQARITDSRFDQAKSVGQNIAQGADVMQVIAGTAQNILKVLVELANNLPRIFGGGGSTAKHLQQDFRGQSYGHVAGGGRTVSYGKG